MRQTQECALLGLLLTGIQFVSDHSTAGWLYRRSAFNQTLGIDFVAADGQTVERMTEKLRLHTAKVFHNGLGMVGSKQMLSS